MANENNLEDFCRNFVYQSDKKRFGVSEHWEVPVYKKGERWFGDCDGFLRAAKHYFPDVFEDWKVIFCKSNNVGHVFLRSPDGTKVFDNMTRNSYVKTGSFYRYNSYICDYSITKDKEVGFWMWQGKMILTYIWNPLIFLSRRLAGNKKNEPIFGSDK